MDKQAQDNLWNELSEETQEAYREKYKFHLADSKRDPKDNFGGGYDLTVLRSETIVKELETMFGEHNLNPKPQIKTWEDVIDEYPEYGYDTITINNLVYIDFLVASKIVATYKIAKLIEFGYGGVVSEEDWANDEIAKHYIVPTINGKNKNIKITGSYEYEDKHFIAFHTKQQAEEFMSYESNRKLVEQYYMI